MKQVLKYPGSKWRIAGDIVDRIPEHHTYLEPFFGSGAVFFSKEPSKIEMINDLDNNVPNLFRCIRDDPEKLASIVAATPYARYEYERAFASNDEQDNFKRAADFLVMCWQGHGFRTNGYRVGWKNDVHGRESMYALRNWYNLPKIILQTAERLRCVQIDNRPALEVIKRFNYQNVFMYIDPPYILGTRTARQYKYEMTDEDHIELLEVLKESNAMIMISGYESDLYDNMLKGWYKEQFRSNAEYGGNRVETIWMNYERQLNINEFQQQIIFYDGLKTGDPMCQDASFDEEE